MRHKAEAGLSYVIPSAPGSVSHRPVISPLHLGLSLPQTRILNLLPWLASSQAPFRLVRHKPRRSRAGAGLIINHILRHFSFKQIQLHTHTPAHTQCDCPNPLRPGLCLTGMKFPSALACANRHENFKTLPFRLVRHKPRREACVSQTRKPWPVSHRPVILKPIHIMCDHLKFIFSRFIKSCR